MSCQHGLVFKVCYWWLKVAMATGTAYQTSWFVHDAHQSSTASKMEMRQIGTHTFCIVSLQCSFIIIFHIISWCMMYSILLLWVCISSDFLYKVMTKQDKASVAMGQHFFQADCNGLKTAVSFSHLTWVACHHKRGRKKVACRGPPQTRSLSVASPSLWLPCNYTVYGTKIEHAQRTFPCC